MTVNFETRVRNLLEFGQVSGPSACADPLPDKPAKPKPKNKPRPGEKSELAEAYYALYSAYHDPRDLETAEKLAGHSTPALSLAA